VGPPNKVQEKNLIVDRSQGSRIKWDLESEENMTDDADQLKRIADAIEEILRIVKKDMEPKNEKNKIQK
jgi:hypothetical protein